MTAHVRTIPACMNQAEYDAWDADPLARIDTPCRDCTDNWYLARRAEGRCNGTPGDEPEVVWKPISVETRNARNRARMAQKRMRNCVRTP